MGKGCFSGAVIYKYVKKYYSDIYSRRLISAAGVETTVNSLESFGYEPDFLNKLELHNFPFWKVYPCGSLANYIDLCNTINILNLGSGFGLDGLYIQHKSKKTGTPVRVINLDVVYHVLAEGKQWLDKSGIFDSSRIKWVCGNGYVLPFANESFSCVVVNGAFNLFKNKELLLTEIRRVMIADGSLFIADIVSCGDIPVYIKGNLDAWAWNMAGALSFNQIKDICSKAGFSKITLLEGEEIIKSMYYRAVIKVHF